jgi:hypothetical protein
VSDSARICIGSARFCAVCAMSAEVSGSGFKPPILHHSQAEQGQHTTPTETLHNPAKQPFPAIPPFSASGQILAPSEQEECTSLHEKCVTGVHGPRGRSAEPTSTSEHSQESSLSPEAEAALAPWRSLSPELREVAQSLPELPEAVKARIVGIAEGVAASRG